MFSFGMCFIYGSLTFPFMSNGLYFAYTVNTVRKELASILGPTSFSHPSPPERCKDILLLWCAAPGAGLVLVEISCCSTSSHLSVQAQLPSSSHVPCF